MRKRLILLIVLFALTLAGVQAAQRLRQKQRRVPNWSVVPYDMKDWQGLDTTFDPIYGSDPATSSLLRIYSNTNQGPVIVYVGFYSDLAAILEVHTPELCYPAQGWSISSMRKTIEGRFHGRSIPAKEILADKSGTKRLVMWWYNAGSKPFENRIRYVYAVLMMSMFTGRTDGSLVRIESPIGPGGEAVAEARIEDFCRHFLPELEKALP